LKRAAKQREKGKQNRNKSSPRAPQFPPCGMNFADRIRSIFRASEYFVEKKNEKEELILQGFPAKEIVRRKIRGGRMSAKRKRGPSIT